jgi:N-acetylglutamate synthase-like GNAT family acetyltransferase
VSVRVKKIRRRRVEGEIVVEQTRDLVQVTAIFERCGANVERVTPAGCYLLAYAGAEAVGVVGVETVVDAGLISILMVIEPMRRRGIGAALVAAARKAAHTRGARQLFSIASDSGYLPRFGFAPISMSELRDAIGDKAPPDLSGQSSGEARPWMAFSLDISQDGLILR